jgi:hypothetical protein
VFETWVVSRIFGPKRKKVTRVCMRNSIKNSHSTLNINKVIKSGKIMCVGQVASMGEYESIQNLDEKHEETTFMTETEIGR